MVPVRAVQAAGAPTSPAAERQVVRRTGTVVLFFLMLTQLGSAPALGDTFQVDAQRLQDRRPELFSILLEPVQTRRLAAPPELRSISVGQGVWENELGFGLILRVAVLHGAVGDTLVVDEALYDFEGIHRPRYTGSDYCCSYHAEVGGIPTPRTLKFAAVEIQKIFAAHLTEAPEIEFVRWMSPRHFLVLVNRRIIIINRTKQGAYEFSAVREPMPVE